MCEVKVWEEKVVIPTYEIGDAEKNPIFWISGRMTRQMIMISFTIIM